MPGSSQLLVSPVLGALTPSGLHGHLYSLSIIIGSGDQIEAHSNNSPDVRSEGKAVIFCLLLGSAIVTADIIFC